ncbi:MAG: DinB family protein [Reichenbachiella sp.]|uniref:DinB family protein n=1 Tax=Reichenbachiella sp. TaxID=2184521 RepID=UPI003267BD6E
MPILKPEPNEYHEFYSNYVNLPNTDDILRYMADQKDEFIRFIQKIPVDKYNYAYAEGKWTIKQLVRHIIDAERMFAFRAMSIARGEQTMLPGFDEQGFVDRSDDSNNSMSDLLEEFESLRTSNVSMISHFTPQATKRIGNANGSQVSVRAIIFIIAGHLRHHKTVITERYLTHV